MTTFCTIINSNYYPLVKVLFSSLKKYFPDSRFHVLFTDNFSLQSEAGIEILRLKDIGNTDIGNAILKKYANSHNDVFRWSLKPVIIHHLISCGYSKVIFTDPDIYFTGNASFITDLLDKYTILLTPHWADMDIINNADSVFSVLKGGLFNAGFVAANSKGLSAIRCWANMCHYKMERREDLGIYDDQKYLDILPVQFENVHILKHQGCNLASWNIQTCKRELVNGKLLINNQFEPIFIHFTKDTIINILNRNDALLKPYLDEYIRLLGENGFDLLKSLENFDPVRYDTSFYKLKHKLRLRTRLKRFLYKLAEKL